MAGTQFVGQFLTDFITIKTVIIVLIMVGLITIMTVMTYLLEQRAHRVHRPRFTQLAHLIEAASVIVSVILLRQIFLVINAGDVRSWSYAMVQLTVLMFSLYTMHNWAVTVVNVITPIFFYSRGLSLGLNGSSMVILMTMIVLLIMAIIYIQRHQTEMFATPWKSWALELVYGGTWCVIVWTVHPFNGWYTVAFLVIFMSYMAVVRFLVIRISRMIDRLTRLDQVVYYDELTGIHNRASFDQTSADIFDFYGKHSHIPVTMVMFDIDHFKAFNDQYGHLTGDAVLRHVAQHFYHELFNQASHGEIFRYGGEEFVIMFRSRDVPTVQRIVTTIRDSLQADPLVADGQPLAITVSFGIAGLKASDPDFDSWFERVDHYLYQSKRAGRNRMTVSGKTVTLDPEPQ